MTLCNIDEVKRAVVQKWRWLLLGETVRSAVVGLLADPNRGARVEQELSEVRRLLQEEQVAHSKAKRNVQRLWNFIALRNKPLKEEGIEQLLKRL